MAWSKRTKKQEKDSPVSEGLEWIYSTSIDEAIETLRTGWRKNGIHAESSDWALIQLAHIAVMRGLTRRAAPLLVRLMEKREADGKLRWNLDGGSIGAVGISMVRLMAAYLEDPEVPVHKARAAVQLFLRSIEPHDELKTVHRLMPMIMAVRCADASHGDQAGRHPAKLPLRTDMEASGMCAPAHRQWHVEYMLAVGAEAEALELAHKGRSEKPCGASCAFAPHSMYAWILEPLQRRGRGDEARVLADRLAGLVLPRLLYLDAMGCLIHYLTLEGEFAEAGRLLASMLKLAEENEASPWQRLKFYVGCAKALNQDMTNGQRHILCGTVSDSFESVQLDVLRKRDDLRHAFAIRER